MGKWFPAPAVAAEVKGVGPGGQEAPLSSLPFRGRGGALEVEAGSWAPVCGGQGPASLLLRGTPTTTGFGELPRGAWEVPTWSAWLRVSSLHMGWGTVSRRLRTSGAPICLSPTCPRPEMWLAIHPVAQLRAQEPTPNSPPSPLPPTPNPPRASLRASPKHGLSPLPSASRPPCVMSPLGSHGCSLICQL